MGPLKKNGEGDCETTMPGDNFKANLALDSPKSLNELVGVSPKQLYSNFKKTKGAESIRFRWCNTFFVLLPPGRVASQLPQRTSRVTSSICQRASLRQSDLPSMPLMQKSRLCFALLLSGSLLRISRWKQSHGSA